MGVCVCVLTCLVPLLQVCFWDLAAAQGARSATGSGVPPGPDGLFRPLRARGKAVNALAVCGSMLVTGHEDGALCLFACK